MAEFVNVMKKWATICRSQAKCTEKCPLKHKAICEYGLQDCTENDIIEGESIIIKWGTNHKQAYPTWAEFLQAITGQMVDGDLLDSHIPDDIAQALHIKPKGDET